MADFFTVMGKTKPAWWPLFFVLIAYAVPVASQDTKPNATERNETAGPLKEAEAYFRKGSFDQAVAKYIQVLNVDPHAARAYAGIARCYLKQDKVREAAEILNSD